MFINQLKVTFGSFDPWLFGGAILLTLGGLSTLFTFSEGNFFFKQQLIWLVISLVIMLLAFILDYRWLRSSHTAFYLYLVAIFFLILTLILGTVVRGAQSRFDLFFFSLQMSEPAKLVLIALLAKYFSKRHIMIANFGQIFLSGLYTFIFFVLVAIQPDLGSAIILVFIWLGMILVSGVRLKHLALVLIAFSVSFALLWQFGFYDYQKERVLTLLNPLEDIHGAGYNARQSIIAVGSGLWLGKGIGYGTQSKLHFLPEWETDFIFAAFAEEWGLIGCLFLFAIFTLVIFRLLYHSTTGATNFERLFSVGVAILFISHFFIHIGMNIGLLPVTGTTLPFLSYGGSHLVTEFLAIAVVMAMRRYAPRVKKQQFDVDSDYRFISDTLPESP